jgi:hypothetical protein
VAQDARTRRCGHKGGCGDFGEHAFSIHAALKLGVLDFDPGASHLGQLQKNSLGSITMGLATPRTFS